MMLNTYCPCQFARLMGFALLLGWLPLASAVTDCKIVTQVPQTECEALIDLYNNTEGSNWKNKTGWNDTDKPCDWYGVTCHEGHIIRLQLDYNQLNGLIPASLGNLNGLQHLLLGHNQLKGSIHASIGNLKKLEDLGLYNNQLSGFIPFTIGQLNKLQYLDLSWNQLSGAIPESLGNLTELKELYLQVNQLNSLPTSIGNLNKLGELDLDNNKLTFLPASLGNLKELYVLYLSNNQLSSLPVSLGNLVNLAELELDGNHLSGAIPNWLNNLKNINYLNLSNNQFSGPIPGFIHNFEELNSLWLSNNQLRGYIPAWLQNLKYLMELFLDHNQLYGFIPAQLGNLKYLNWLHLHNNELCGDIPVSLMELPLPSFAGIELNNNHLTTSDPNLIEWLNGWDPLWLTTQTPCPNDVYALHDEGLNNSQFFTINSKNNDIKAFGFSFHGYDIEGMDIHPLNNELYVSSGDDPSIGHEPGFIYRIQHADATLIPVCHTGLGEVSAISFHPTEGTLWVWADGRGLFTIDVDICDKTEKLLHSAKVEGITWDNEGKILYGSEGTTLYKYSYDTGEVKKACDDFPSEVEALDMLADGTLLFALHEADDVSIHSFDIENCSVVDEVPLPVETPYSDIEGITWVFDSM